MKYLKTYEKITVKNDYKTELQDKNIYIYNYNQDIINSITCEQCIINWYVDIKENDEEIGKIDVKIIDIDLRLNKEIFTHLNVDNFETISEIENFKISQKKKINIEFEHGNTISFPLKPKGLEINYRNMTIVVEFD